MAICLGTATPMRIPILLLALLINQAACAEERAATGLGAGSCAVFAEIYRENTLVAENSYGAWADGFMAGLNAQLALNKQPMRNLAAHTYDRRNQMLRQGCDRRPLALFMQIVLDYFRSLPTTAP